MSVRALLQLSRQGPQRFAVKCRGPHALVDMSLDEHSMGGLSLSVESTGNLAFTTDLPSGGDLSLENDLMSVFDGLGDEDAEYVSGPAAPLIRQTRNIMHTHELCFSPSPHFALTLVAPICSVLARRCLCALSPGNSVYFSHPTILPPRRQFRNPWVIKMWHRPTQCPLLHQPGRCGQARA